MAKRHLLTAAIGLTAALTVGLEIAAHIPHASSPSSAIGSVPVASASIAGASSAPSEAASEEPAYLGGCNCPRLPRLATDASPAPGAVIGELSYDDVRAFFGTRDVKYGSWNAGVAALAHDVDPTGALRIAVGPVPPITNEQAPFTEGTLADGLIETKLHTDYNGKPYYWGYNGDVNGVVQRLIDTLARTDKYGETAASMRESVTQLGHFLTVEFPLYDELGPPPPKGTHLDFIATFGASARASLLANVAHGASNPLEDGHRTHPLQIRLPNGVQSLDLTDFDRAQAALDILMMSDAQHPIDASRLAHSIGAVPNDEQSAYEYPEASTLINVAASRSIFGGEAAPGTPGDIVACQAYAALLAFMRAPDPNGRTLRRAVLKLASAPGFTDRPTAQALAADALLAEAGFTSDDEARQNTEYVAKPLASMALRTNASHRNVLAATLRALLSVKGTGSGAAADASAEEHTALAQRLSKVVNEERSSTWQPVIDYDKAVAAEYQADVAVWPNAGVSMQTQAGQNSVPATEPPATCPNDSCNVDVASEDASTPAQLDDDWSPQIRVAESNALNAQDSATSVYRDEPFQVFVVVPIDHAPDDRRIEVHFTAKSGASDLALYEDHTDAHYAYYSSYASTIAAGGEGAYGLVTRWVQHRGRGNLHPTQTEDGETIVLSYHGTSVPLTVYNTSWTRRIAQNNASTDVLWAYYNDMLQDSSVPAADKAANGPIHLRLKWIANYRWLMSHDLSGPKFFYTDRSRAYVGDGYLALLQSSKPEANVGGYIPSGMSAAFYKDMVWTGTSETEMLRMMLDRANQETKDAAWHNVAQLTIATYDAFVAASCFYQNIPGAEAIPCADQAWTILTGTDTHGEPVSASSYAFTVVNATLPVWEYLGKSAMAAMQEEHAAAAAASNAEKREVAQSRRSQGTAGPAPTELELLEQIDADLHMEQARVDMQAAIPGSVQVRPSGRQVPMILQQFDDTCVLESIEFVRRKNGLSPLREHRLIEEAYKLERAMTKVKGERFYIYSPGYGTSNKEYLARALGFEAYTAQELHAAGKIAQPKFTLREMQAGLKRDMSFIVGVGEKNLVNPAKSWEHVVVVDSVYQDVNGLYRVRYGDPATGNFWDVDGCAFERLRRLSDSDLALRLPRHGS